MLKRLACVAVLVTAGTSFADPKFEYGKKEELKKPVEYNASVEAGAVFTTGNSETTTVTGGVKAARKKGDNKISFDASVAYARSGQRVINDQNGNDMIDSTDEITTIDQITAETFAGKLRYDRFLTDFNSLYIAALASRDLPAGKKYVVGGQAGYSRRLYKSEKAEAVGEVGYDYSREELVGGNGVSIHSLRAFVGFKAEMTEGATFETSAEGLTNVNKEHLDTEGGDASFGDDTRVNVKASISAKIGKNLAFQTSLEVHYDHRPAPLKIDGLAMDYHPEASRMDTIMKASLIYTIF